MNLKSSEKLLCAALWYARKNGYAAFPLCPGTKIPLTSNGFYSATKDERQIKDWWTEFPNANIGIATGPRSNLIVLDIDHKDHLSAADVLSEFEMSCCRLPKTPHVLTGGGGYQFYFTSSKVIPTRHRLFDQVDVKAEGGYVVAPPSVHPSGKEYTWESSHRINEMPVAPLPDVIEKIILEKKSGPGKSSNDWMKLVQSGAKEGCRNHTVAQISGHLLGKGVDPSVVNEMMQCWNQIRNLPPLSEREIERTVFSIDSIENRKKSSGGKNDSNQ